MLFSWLTERLDRLIYWQRQIVVGQAQILARLDKIVEHFIPPEPVRADVVLGAPESDNNGEFPMAKKSLAKSGPPIDMTQLQTDGATLTLYDAGGNAVPFDPASTVAWSTSDSTILSVSGNGATAKISTPNPAKLGSATVSADVTLPNGTKLPTATSPTINIKSTTPATADITLSTPTP